MQILISAVNLDCRRIGFIPTPAAADAPPARG
jgi:hypothetical protein